MPIPDLDDKGFLPPGVHDCSLEEVRQHFGTFRMTDRRSVLFERLGRFVHEAWATGLVAEIIIDGSFVTANVRPNDIDLVLVLFAAHDSSTEVSPFVYNVLSSRQARKIYGFDVLAAGRDSRALKEYMEFFSRVRSDPARRKGLLRIQRDQQ